MRKGSLALAGEHHCPEQVQPAVPLAGQQSRRVVTRQRPVAPRIIRIGLRRGKRTDKPGTESIDHAVIAGTQVRSRRAAARSWRTP